VRILLALAMVLLGKALPTPKAAPPMGPGGPTPVPVGPGLGGGAAAVEATASTVKIVNGVIVLVGPGGTLTMAAMQGQGGEGGGGDQPKPKDPGEEKAPAETSKAPESAGPSAAGTGPKPARPLKPPAARHTATRVTQRTLAKGSNTVIEPGVDVAADVAAINGGGATRVGGNYSVNGRTYGVHDGTLYPIDGPGLHPLSRGAFKALGVYNEFGNSARAADILARMGTSQADANAALRVWEIIHP
jgi:hypothetical protein